ncbi:MAG: PAS domain S-box protein [Verrucomicrobia bacterium]|nr:PAS domain S-box protein [Verrucomicrobiota bacterium]
MTPSAPHTRPARRTWGAILTVIAVGLLAGGYWTAQWRVDAIDRDLRDQLLGQATAIARTINADQVSDLTFTPADKREPRFQRLRVQMMAYQTVIHCRGIYSLARRGDALVFGPESYAEDDPQASPPGTVFKQPTAAARAIFQNRQAFTEGPVADEYGTFVSAFAPVLNPATGEVLMVIGLDVEAAEWLAALARERNVTALWVGVLALMLCGGAWVLHWRDRLPAKRQASLRHAEPCIVAICGLGLTFVMVLAVLDGATRSRRRIFRQLADAHASRIVDAFQNLRNHQLSALSRFCQGAQQMSRDEFRAFAGPIVREGSIQAIQALAWVPAVPAAETAALETTARASGLTDFLIWQRGADGRRAPAVRREVHYPVWLMEPLAGNESVLGYDHGAESVRRAALETALHTGLPTMTDPVTLIMETEKSAGLLVFQPVFSGVPPARVFRGFALVVLRADSFLRAGLSGRPLDDMSPLVDLYQVQPGEPLRHLAPSSSRERTGHESALARRKLIHPEMGDTAVFPIFEFGKSFGLVLRPGPAFLATYPSRAGWETALWGLLLTTVLTAYAAFVVHHRAGLEAQTAELRTTLYSIGDGVITTDTLGRVQKMNPVAEHLTGWAETDAVGEHLDAVFRSVNESTRGPVPNPVEQVVREGVNAEPVNHTLLIARDGTERPIVDNAAAIRDEHGGVTGVVLVFSDQTRRKQAEANLRKLSRTIEQAPLSVVITDLSGAIEYVNPKFCEVTGYTIDELRGQNPRMLKSGRTPPEVYLDMWQTLSRGQVWRGELHNRKKNGQIYVELAVIAPVLGSDGPATHYVALKEDITERKRGEAQLRQSLMELRTLHAVSLAIQRQELQGDDLLSTVVKNLPAAMRRMADAQAVIEIDGRTYRAGAEGTLTDGLSAPVTVNGRSAGTVTVGYVRRGGSVPGAAAFLEHERETVESVARTIGLGLGGREAFSAVERFNAELEEKVAQRTTELAARNREVQALLQAIPDMVMRLRTDGTVLHCQRAHGSAGLATLACNEGWAPRDSATADLMESSRQLGRRALAQDTTVTAEIEIASPGGSVPVELRAAPSGPEEFVVFVRDITERKRLEAETAAMLEKERQVSEMKTRFISVTSHEFLTPMAAAMGSARLLANHLDRLAPPKRQELLDRINSSLRRMTEMLDDVLTLNRVDAKRMEVRLVPVDLRHFVRNVVEEIRVGDRDAHRFELHAPGEPAPFVSDLNLLHHIFSNLLSNAVRYSPAGTLVSVRMAEDASGVQVVVEDHGIGIPPADLTRIFEPFERGSNVGNIKGTGLGLNIVKRMTEMLGGTIAVSPAEDGGSRFTLVFPRLSAPACPS